MSTLTLSIITNKQSPSKFSHRRGSQTTTTRHLESPGVIVVFEFTFHFQNSTRSCSKSLLQISRFLFPNMRYVKEESMCNNDHAIDWNSAVEELHALSSQDLNKLLRDSENFTVQLNNEKGSMIQIDLEKLAWSLPLHLIAVLVLPSGDEMHLRYLLRGVRLLHSLCDLASRHNTRLEQILLEEVKITEQILDLVFYMLLVLARYEQENFVGHFVPLLHSALVACSLHLLTGYVSSQWQDLVHVLLAHPKVDIFMDVAFDAVRVDIRFFQSKLSALNNDMWCEKSNLLGAERIAHNLSQQCETSLQFLQSLCQQKLFRERLLKNKELCKHGGILSLARVILNLNIPPHFKESSTIVAAVSRLKSKVLSILLQLCETESISYLDEVASSPRSMHLAKSVVLEVLELLKTAFSGGSKRHNDCFDNTNPKGHVLLNSMRLADIFSDDSNFRSFIMTNITQVLAEIFALPREEFLSSWCSTELPVMEEDATLEYDPFVAAGVVLVLCTGLGAALSASNPLNETNTACPFVLNSMPPVSHAQQRTSFLVKIIANLHCFVPNICEEQERHLFLNKFIECLQMEPPKCSSIFSFGSDAQRAAAICENLCSLLNHARSLIPNLLNEEDVQLLSDFLQKLQALLPPAQFGDNSILESVIKDGNKMQDKKFEASSLERENSLCWTKYNYLGFRENKRGDAGGSRNQSPLPQLAGDDDHQLSEDAQSTGECASSLITKLDATVLEESPDSKQKNRDLKEDISECPMFQEVDQFNAMSKHVDLTDDVMELDRSGRKDKILTGRIASGSLREIDKVTRNVETSSSDVTSTKGKHCLSQILDNGEFPKLTEHMKESGFRGVAPENEKGEAAQGEEKQPRKRKRNIMNEKQITVIEKALLDEPEMQRNAALLQTWADKLSAHGSELTSSQLKNWLNNRKARLARAAREVRAPSEGENAFPDKACGSSLGHFYDSPESAGEDFYIPSRTSRGNQNTSKFEMPPTDFVDFAAQHSIQMNCPTLRYPRCQPGQFVSLTDGEGKEVAEGKVYQVDGRWHGKSLEDVGTYVVDVIDLKVDRWLRLQHPSEVTGTTFEEAESKNGVMRVAWDANKVFLLPQ